MEFEQTLPPLQPPAEPEQPTDRTPWGYADMAMAIGTVIGGTILVGAPFAVVAIALAGGTQGNDDLATAILLSASVLGEVFLLLAVALFTVGKYKVPWAALGLRLPRKGTWWVPLALLFGAMVVVWTYFAVLAVLGAQPSSNIPSDAFDNVPLVVLVGVLSLGLAPFMEEMFFRGFLFGGLRGRWGVFWSALGTGLLFSLAHMDPLVFIPFTAVGMLFAWGYFYSGSLLASMIAHLLFNAISFSLAVSGVAT
jgi:membrane protease YdiL (CAAX protease family)